MPLLTKATNKVARFVASTLSRAEFEKKKELQSKQGQCIFFVEAFWWEDYNLNVISYIRHSNNKNPSHNN